MTDSLPVSVLLLARDEAPRLERLLPLLSFAREVVVVCDPAGCEAERDVAARHGARFFTRAFDGFGPQRQFGLEQCTQPWMLWIDADEWPDAALIVSLRSRLGNAATESAGAAGLRLARRTWFLGRRIRFCGWGTERIVRAGRRDRVRFDDAPVHERLFVEGRIEDVGGMLEHHSYASIDECTRKMTRYARAGAERAWKEGRRASSIDVAVRPALRFLRQYVLQLGFLDGVRGLLVCCFSAGQVYLKYATLWERTRAARGGADS
ncbi:MAG TPA: glycosyltransferase family 2 protein [Candidatus Udaeobacter sp.]|jgi:(heptosyl)LPS beta-1,4-glucosyltransferase|nr:glycosyltransferase family 2 protein [Candidatus Udaeobacter sp.]